MPDTVNIQEVFPEGDAAGEWVVLVSMAMNDLATLDYQVHRALSDSDDNSAPYYFRLLCSTLRELWWLFEAATTSGDVKRLIDGLVTEASEAFAELQALFTRPEVTEDNPEPKSWAEEHLRDIRNRTFHYPDLGGQELRDALKSSGSVSALIRKAGSRPLAFADVVALHASFGDIDNPDKHARFNEIVSTSKRISELLIPITWSALGTHMRALGIDPSRLREVDNPDPEAANAGLSE